LYLGRVYGDRKTVRAERSVQDGIHVHVMKK
jgi:hypothetical protein